MISELIILLVSIAVIGVSLYVWKRAKHLLANGKIATGTIIDNIYEYTAKGGVYYPVVRFLTAKKEWITKQLDTGSNPPMTEGRRVEVVYDSEAPENFMIYSPVVMKVVPLVFVAIGVCGFVFGVLEVLEITQLVD